MTNKKYCEICRNRELDSRCPVCKRLPKDPQLAILAEAHDILAYLEKVRKLNNDAEIVACLKVLTGVVTKLVKDTRKLRFPFGSRKGIPKHSPNCSIHDPPHDHCDCVIDRQPKTPRLQRINWEEDEYSCLNCGEFPVGKEHKCDG